MPEPRIRAAVRAVVLDPDDRVLLIEGPFQGRATWATPGGGMDPGETDEQTLRRELLEEAGLEAFEFGQLLWRRTHRIPLESGRWDGQGERIYLVRTPAFEPAPRLSWEQLRSEGVTAIRWWSLDELEAAGTVFSPRRLPALIRSLIEDGPPVEPLDVGL